MKLKPTTDITVFINHSTKKTMITIKLYQFDELSQAAQEIAISEERERREERGFNNVWEDCQKDAAKEFLKAFDLSDSVRKRIELYSDYITGQAINQGSELVGLRLRTWLINNYSHVFYETKRYYKRHKARYSKIFKVVRNFPLTGIYYDKFVLQPMRDFITKPTESTTLESLLYDCLHALDKAIEAEEQYFYSDEGIGYDLTHEYNQYYTDAGHVVEIDVEALQDLETV